MPDSPLPLVATLPSVTLPLETLRPPAPGLCEPQHCEQPCEVCSATVRFSVVRTPPGTPDLIRAMFPDSAWFGWCHSGERGVQPTGDGTDTLSILVLCSLACQVEWLDSNYGPGV